MVPNDQFYFVTAAFNFDMNIQNMVARRKMNEMRLEFMYAILRLSYEIELIIAQWKKLVYCLSLVVFYLYISCQASYEHWDTNQFFELD